MQYGRRFIHLALLGVLALGCSSDDERAANPADSGTSSDASIPQPDAGPDADVDGNVPDTEAGAAVVTLDCTAKNPACPQVQFLGDAPHNNIFSGFADPSVRRDPNSGRLWMTYSWPRMFGPFNGTTLIETHAAHSDDDGATWTFNQPLYEAENFTNPVTAAANYLSNEIVTTLAVDNGDGSTSWFAARLQYPVVPAQFIYNQLGTHSYLLVAKASSVAGLKTAEEAVLAPAGLRPEYSSDVDLSKLHTDVGPCLTWMEEALFFDNGRLYLAAQCWVVQGSALAHDQFFYAVFSTDPSGSPKSWSWVYEGRFLGHSEAQEFGHTFFNQLDFARKADGTIIILTTLGDEGDAKRDKYHGCVALEVASLSPPSVVRNNAGDIKTLARITASDLTEFGPAACAYDDSSKTGILITRRVFGDPVVGTRWTVHETGIRL